MLQNSHKLVHVHFDKEGGLGPQGLTSVDAVGSQITSGASLYLVEPHISM